MILLCGATLGAGLVLMVAPWLWPAGGAATRRSGKSRGIGRRLLEGAGFAHVAVSGLGAVSLASAVLAAAIAWLVTSLPAVALIAAAVGGTRPDLVVAVALAEAAPRAAGLWPDVCDLLVASVRAGMPLGDAVSSIAETGPPPLRPAFRGFERDLAASGHFDTSAARLQAVLADPIADRIVETLRMARQVGGTELVPVLQALSGAVRADAALRAEMKRVSRGSTAPLCSG